MNGQVTVALLNPKFTENWAGAIRACACFGADRLVWTGDRLSTSTLSARRKLRVPREYRLHHKRLVIARYSEISELIEMDREAVPVVIENCRDYQRLHDFQHPRNAIYLFGPEDGSVLGEILPLPEVRVYIPSAHSLALDAAVYLTLYDRSVKENAWKENAVHSSE